MRIPLFTLAPLIAASPVVVDCADSPSVNFHPKSAQGEAVTINGVVREGEAFESYLGIPFAEPPVEGLRWQPAQPYDFSQNKTLDGSTYRSSCIQLSTFGANSPTPDNPGGAGSSEDCLYLNVFTPPGASGKPSSLPVIVTIYGGGYTSGSAQVGDPVDFLPNAMDFGLPVVWVTLNYRLGTFGWPNGPQFAEEGSANLGLTDAIKALEWVQENIGAFGGDAQQVTLLGQSAGAGVISLLYLQYQRELFESAIMMSGAPPVTNVGPTADISPEGWNRFFELLNCTGDNEVACARSVSTEEVIAAYTELFQEFPRGNLIGPSVDGYWLTDSPYSLLGSGKWAKRPFIAGSCKDEDTLFATTTANETTLRASMRGSGLFQRSEETIERLLELYPADPAQGSPFDTGDELFNATVIFKRNAAYSGDATFHAPRRNFLDVAREQGFEETWSFLFDHVPKGIELNPGQGAFHGIDLNFTRGRPTENDASWWNAEDINLTKAIMEYWYSRFALRFTYQADPSREVGDKPVLGSSDITTDAFVPWPKYGGPEQRNMMLLRGDGRTVIQDDFRSSGIDYINEKNVEYGY